VQVGGVAPDKPLDSAVLCRLKQFSAMNKLKKIAIRVSIHYLFKNRNTLQVPKNQLILLVFNITLSFTIY